MKSRDSKEPSSQSLLQRGRFGAETPNDITGCPGNVDSRIRARPSVRKENTKVVRDCWSFTHLVQSYKGYALYTTGMFFAWQSVYQSSL